MTTTYKGTICSAHPEKVRILSCSVMGINHSPYNLRLLKLEVILTNFARMSKKTSPTRHGKFKQ